MAANEADDKAGGSTIVIKRIKKGGHAHHGGAWKIAYADFVTAMMAFFLLMWLLSSLSPAELVGIQDYFDNPMKVGQGGEGVANRDAPIPGGGRDLTTEAPGVQKSADAKKAEEAAARKDREQLNTLKEEITSVIRSDPVLQQYENQLYLDLTEDGLRIQILDEQNRPMFASGRADLQPFVRDILNKLAVHLRTVQNSISISGHTDSAGFVGGPAGYSNWELSSERANAARRQLIAGGVTIDRILRVEGLADSVPFLGNDTTSPQNRRISIVVLGRETERRIRQSGNGSMTFGESAVANPVSSSPDGVRLLSE